MAPKNLQEVIDAAKSPVELLRNSQIGSYIYPVVPADFQNWIKEQKAWRDTAVLYDQSHHMDNLFLRGSDAITLISDTAINSTALFPVDKAKQYVPTTASCSAKPKTSTSMSAARPPRTGCCTTARPAATRTSTSRSTAARRRVPTVTR